MNLDGLTIFSRKFLGTAKAAFAALGILLLIQPSASNAHDRNGQSGIGGGIGYSVPVFGTRFNDAAEPDVSWGAWYRHYITSNWVFGIDVVRDEFSETPAAFTAFTAGADYRFSGTNSFSLIAGFRAGFPFFSGVSDRDKSYLLMPRFGADWHLSECFSIDLVAEYHHVDSAQRDDMPSGPWHNVTPKIGLTYFFGSGSKAEVARPAPADPAPTKLAAAPVADEDGDGVSDSDDKCQNSPKDKKVNSFGCTPEEKAVVRLEVLFQSGKSEIDPTETSSLKEFASFLEKFPKVTVQIEGHTDSSGARNSNVKISKARAEAVVNELVKLGIARGRLTAKGFGPDAPIADNKTTEGRAKNRRVVAVVQE